MTLRSNVNFFSLSFSFFRGISVYILYTLVYIIYRCERGDLFFSFFLFSLKRPPKVVGRLVHRLVRNSFVVNGSLHV